MPISDAEWRRRCGESARRSRERREALSPHPWPDKGEWLVGLLIAVALIAAGYALLVAAAAVAS